MRNFLERQIRSVLLVNPQLYSANHLYYTVSGTVLAQHPTEAFVLIKILLSKWEISFWFGKGLQWQDLEMELNFRQVMKAGGQIVSN